MDVNDLGSPKLSTEITKEAPVAARPNGSRPQQTTPEQNTDDVKIELSDAQVNTTSLRNKANEVINIINITATATGDIENLVQSVGGIVEQANLPEITDTRRTILQNEANQLIEEIRSKAFTAESNGIRPLLGDSIRFDVEQKYGDALEIILPDTAKDAFGIGQINLSMKDTIISTIARVESAKKQFEELRTSVDNAASSVKKTVDTLEVALQNNEASKATIRSVDEALSVATTAHTQISKNPELALESLGKLDINSTTLLRT